MALPQTDVFTVNPNIKFFKVIGILIGTLVFFEFVGLFISVFQILSPFIAGIVTGVYYGIDRKFGEGAIHYYIKYFRTPNYLSGNIVENDKIAEVKSTWQNNLQ